MTGNVLMVLQLGAEEESLIAASAIVRFGTVTVQVVQMQLKAGGSRENRRTNVTFVGAAVAFEASFERVFDEVQLQLGFVAADKRLAERTAERWALLRAVSQLMWLLMMMMTAVPVDWHRCG